MGNLTSIEAIGIPSSPVQNLALCTSDKLVRKGIIKRPIVVIPRNFRFADNPEIRGAGYAPMTRLQGFLNGQSAEN
jgi:hypothetical protein